LHPFPSDTSDFLDTSSGRLAVVDATKGATGFQKKVRHFAWERLETLMYPARESKEHQETAAVQKCAFW